MNKAIFLVAFLLTGWFHFVPAKPKDNHLRPKTKYKSPLTRQNIPEVQLEQPENDKNGPLVPDYMDPKALYLAGTGLKDGKVPSEDEPKGNIQVKLENVNDKGSVSGNVKSANEVKPLLDNSASVAPIQVNTESSSQETLEPFHEDCLEAHNTFRAKHGVPPVFWSADLAESAQKWADQLASSDQLRHDPKLKDKGVGENLAFFTPPVEKCQGESVNNCVQCREMVRRWYDEEKAYDFDKGSGKRPHSVTKHFTQLVWADTAEIGVGTAVGHKYGFITVARYRPGGNKKGMFLKDVPPEGGPLPSLPLSISDSTNTTAVSKLSPVNFNHQHGNDRQQLMMNKQKITFYASKKGILQKPTLQKASKENLKAVPKTATNKFPARETSSKKSPEAADIEKFSKEKSLLKSIRIKPAEASHHEFVHTVNANDGSQAQVYLTKNGEHARIVFRNQIYHVETEPSTKRRIGVL